jgi:hypothetical protein
MSSNRLSYDDCSYKQSLQQSVNPLNYTLNPMKFEHNNKCRMELGIVGGTNVSHNKSDLVDVENELRGQTFPSTKCNANKYNPFDNSNKEYIKCSQYKPISPEKEHLKSCQMFGYNSVPRAPKLNEFKCSK